MAIPGFTAEASVGPTKEVYRFQTNYGHGLSVGDSLYPQQYGGGGSWIDDVGEVEDMEMAGDDAELGDVGDDADPAEVGDDLDDDTESAMIEASGDDDLDGSLA